MHHFLEQHSCHINVLIYSADWYSQCGIWCAYGDPLLWISHKARVCLQDELLDPLRYAHILKLHIALNLQLTGFM
jgi:hypothetical protein